MLGAESISIILDSLKVERRRLVRLLDELDEPDWSQPTECPAYTVKGIATHVLGDDLSLLSRQRDSAVDGLVLLAAELPGIERRALLNTFNDRWVSAAAFLSPRMLLELLAITGDATESYYRSVDPLAPGEPVRLLGSTGEASPFWHAIAREYVERWAHHCQIRRALGLGSITDDDLLRPAAEVFAVMTQLDLTVPTPTEDVWGLGSVMLGATSQAADVLGMRYTAPEVTALIDGPPDQVGRVVFFTGRQTS